MSTIENKSLKNVTLKVGDSNWLVREALSHDEAMYAIDMARCSGSVGNKNIIATVDVETVVADVVRLNPDGSECRPYGANPAPATQGLDKAVKPLIHNTNPSAPTATPENIMRTLRQRKDMEANDTSRDDELRALSPIDKLRELAAWELGSADWADQFMKWAKDCGITVTYPTK